MGCHTIQLRGEQLAHLVREATLHRTEGLIRYGSDSLLMLVWTTDFIRRNPELRTRLTRPTDYKRHVNRDNAQYLKWFFVYNSTKEKYSILDQDTYNFDEFGFRLGTTGTSTVVTSAEGYGEARQIQGNNTQWVTPIQGGSATGYTRPPFIVFKGKEFNRAWFEEGLPRNWRVMVSQNGWTTDEITC